MPAAIQVPAFQQIIPPIVDNTGTLMPAAQRYFSAEQAALVAIAQIINTGVGVNSFALAAAPALGPADAGFVGYVTDFGHLVQWTGAAWIFLDGGGGYFSDFPVPPQGLGWQVCDGSATSFLTIGAVLGSTGFTTPDLVTNATYRKSGAYTGAIGAAIAPGASVSGSTASGTTTPDVTGTASVTTSAGDVINTITVNLGILTSVSAQPHTHTVNIPALSIPALVVPALGAGTLAATVDATGEPMHLSVPVYFRR